jgi:hypothetical protein
MAWTGDFSERVFDGDEDMEFRTVVGFGARFFRGVYLLENKTPDKETFFG